MKWHCTACGHNFKGKSPDCPLHKATPDLLAACAKLRAECAKLRAEIDKRNAR